MLYGHNSIKASVVIVAKISASYELRNLEYFPLKSLMDIISNTLSYMLQIYKIDFS